MVLTNLHGEDSPSQQLPSFHIIVITKHEFSNVFANKKKVNKGNFSKR